MNFKSPHSIPQFILRFLGFKPLDIAPIIVNDDYTRLKKLEDENLVMRILINEKIKPALNKVSKESSDLIKVTAQAIDQGN